MIAAPRDQRAAVISAVIKYASDQKIKLPSFWGADIRIIGEEDLPWLLTELTQARYEFAQREFTALIRTVFDWRLPKHVDSILSAMENITVLRDKFAPYFAPVEIGSAKAREMQEAERRRALLSRAPAGSELAPISDRVFAELEKFEAGDIHAWWRLNLELVRSAAPAALRRIHRGSNLAARLEWSSTRHYEHDALQPQKIVT